MTAVDHQVRLFDPATSHAAAAEDRSGLELDVLSAVRAAGSFGATSADIWHRLGYSMPNSIARRLTTLHRKGLVVEAGTRPGDSGRAQTVWIAR